MEKQMQPVLKHRFLIQSFMLCSTVVFLVFTTFTFEFAPNIYSKTLILSATKHFQQQSSHSIQQHHHRLKNHTKRILHYTSFYGVKLKMNYSITCGVKKEYTCEMVSDQSLVESSHALIFHGWRQDLHSTAFEIDGVKKFKPTTLPSVRFPDQYYVLFMLEPPSNYNDKMRCYDDQFNWTMTYRLDSEAYVPYGKFELLKTPAKFQNSSLLFPQTKNKLVAWVLRNCHNVSSNRVSLVKKLEKYVPVDIYGKCGKRKCEKKPNCKKRLGKEYKFYLALENILCQDYMTEKVFLAYKFGMVPIVYGSANYNLFLPPGSYINMNSFPTAKSLADYLIYLDQNMEEYAKFFQWKMHFKLVDNYNLVEGYCQLCEQLHHDYPLGIKKIIPNMTAWLSGDSRRTHRTCSVPLDW